MLHSNEQSCYQIASKSVEFKVLDTHAAWLCSDRAQKPAQSIHGVTSQNKSLWQKNWVSNGEEHKTAWLWGAGVFYFLGMGRLYGQIALLTCWCLKHPSYYSPWMIAVALCFITLGLFGGGGLFVFVFAFWDRIYIFLYVAQQALN